MAAALLITGLSGQHPASNLDLLGYALPAVGGMGLAARRRAPVPVLAVTGSCAVGYQAAGFDVPAVAYLFAVYAAVRAGHRTLTVVASAAVPASLPLAGLVYGRSARPPAARPAGSRPAATPCSHRPPPAS